MTSELDEIVAAMAALPERRRGCRYPAELKEQIRCFVAGRRTEGVSWARLSRALSMPTTTLQRWQAECDPEPSSESAMFLPVQIRDSSASRGGLILETRDGWCVRGLSVADIAQLLAHRA